MPGMLNELFSVDYAEARERLRTAAWLLEVDVESIALPTHIGAEGEPLATDLVLITPPGASALLVITSGTHGVEGFAGSACQIGLLSDKTLLEIAHANQVALLIVHAVNPYGFSHLRRVNEDNVDINRNCVDFTQPLPANADYRDVHTLLLPQEWPPTAQNKHDIAEYCARHGEERLRKALVTGQYEMPDGLFYGGTAPTWSHRTLRAVFKKHLNAYRRAAMIDVHTGLGAHGHGEKIFVGQTAEELARARKLWGSDVMAPASVGSAAVPVLGPIVALAHAEARSETDVTTMALEFGTLASDDVRHSLRGDHWLHLHPEASAAQAYHIKRRIRDAFCCDSDDWKGRVYGQFRTAALQAIMGLGDAV